MAVKNGTFQPKKTMETAYICRWFDPGSSVKIGFKVLLGGTTGPEIFSKIFPDTTIACEKAKERGYRKFRYPDGKFSR